jgi:hypothetical protein
VAANMKHRDGRNRAPINVHGSAKSMGPYCVQYRALSPLTVTASLAVDCSYQNGKYVTPSGLSPSLSNITQLLCRGYRSSLTLTRHL